MTSSGDAEALGDGEPDVAHHRRIGHAEHEIGPRPREPAEQRAADVRDVVERAQAEACPLEGGRRHAHDLDAVTDLMPRQLLVAVQRPGEHADLVLVRQCLAQLREQVRGRLDARPVVLVDDEEARLGGVVTAQNATVHPRGGSRPTDPLRRAGMVAGGRVRRADPGDARARASGWRRTGTASPC